MKKALITLILIGFSVGQAKVKGFNEMIEANSKSQKELLSAVQTQITSAEAASDDSKEYRTSSKNKELKAMEMPASQHNLPTNKDLLAIDKEKYRYQVRPNGKLEKTATELKAAAQSESVFGEE